MKRFAILLVVLAIAVLAWPTRALSGIPLDQIGAYVSGESQKAPPSVSTPSGGVSLDQIATYVGGGEFSVSTEKRKVRKHQARRKAPKKGYIAKKTELKKPPAIPIPSDAECAIIKVARGDNLTIIAKKFGAKTPAQINEAIILIQGKNLIRNANLIREGVEIKVPQLASSAAPATINEIFPGEASASPDGCSTAPDSAPPAPVFTGIVIQC